jgi:hypothetical protein
MNPLCRRLSWRENAHAFVRRGVPSPAVGVQSPPSARRMSRSHPPPEWVRNCVPRLSSLALQSQTAAIFTTTPAQRIGERRHRVMAPSVAATIAALPFPFPSHSAHAARAASSPIPDVGHTCLDCRSSAARLTRGSALSVGAVGPDSHRRRVWHRQDAFAPSSSIRSHFGHDFRDPLGVSDRLDPLPRSGHIS